MVMQLENSQTSLSEERPYLKGIVSQLKCICERLDRIERYVNKDNSSWIEIQDALADLDNRIVCGKVVDSNNNNVEKNLTVSLYDPVKKHKDNRLGTGCTNEVGEFCIVYTSQQLKKCYGKHPPNRHLIGCDASGNQIFLSDDLVHGDRLEWFCIKLSESDTGSA